MILKLDPGLALTYFTARTNLDSCVLNGNNCYKVIKLDRLAANYPIKRRFMFLKRIDRGLSAIYMSITIIFKHLFLLNRLANESQILCEGFLGSENINFVKNHLGHINTRPRWPPCPYMVQTLKNLHVQNRI